MQNNTLPHKITKEKFNLLELSLMWRDRMLTLAETSVNPNDGELAAFISYALSFPSKFVALVDTYNVIQSGIPNFCAVALALNDLQYQAIGIRIDSGDLAYLAQYAYTFFTKIAVKYNANWIKNTMIIVSNDINEETISSLNDQTIHINGFGIGTNLVTCQRQPALGCVYKMVEINGRPRLKLSEDTNKMTLPGKKEVFRLYGNEGYALIDIMLLPNELPKPEAGKKFLCRDIYDRSKRCYVKPQRVEKLHKLQWKGGRIIEVLPTVDVIKKRVQDSLASLRGDLKRNLNPTPYKISASENMYSFIHAIWLENAPIGELT